MTRRWMLNQTRSATRIRRAASRTHRPNDLPSLCLSGAASLIPSMMLKHRAKRALFGQRPLRQGTASRCCRQAAASLTGQEVIEIKGNQKSAVSAIGSSCVEEERDERERRDALDGDPSRSTAGSFYLVSRPHCCRSNFMLLFSFEYI